MTKEALLNVVKANFSKRLNTRMHNRQITPTYVLEKLSDVQDILYDNKMTVDEKIVQIILHPDYGDV